VAIKRINDVFRYEQDTRRFLREIHILRLVRHPIIIQLLDLFVHGSEESFQELYLVFEVCVCVCVGGGLCVFVCVYGCVCAHLYAMRCV